jgi:hypothetical protein
MKTTLNKFEKAAIRRNLKTLMPSLKAKAKLQDKIAAIEAEIAVIDNTITAIDTQTHVICGYTMEELTEYKTIELMNADGTTTTKKVIDFKYPDILPPVEVSQPEVIESTQEEEIAENEAINELNELPEPPAEVEVDIPTENQAPVDGEEIAEVFESQSTPKQIEADTDEFSF